MRVLNSIRQIFHQNSENHFNRTNCKRNFSKTIMMNVFVFNYVVLGGTLIFAQEKESINYHSAIDFTLVGKIMDTQHFFHRVDTAMYSNMPNSVKTRLLTSAGMAITFESNSLNIYSKWCDKEQGYISHMTPLAIRGLDLYIKKNEKWQHAGVGRPSKDENCSSSKLVGNLSDGVHEFLLYLPLYSELSNLEIGIDDGAFISGGIQPFSKRILVYGSSIVQGASASRPGMAYTSKLSRESGFNFLNLGMSGVARMEKEVSDMVSDISADAYILDCIPNSSPEQITERTAYLVKQIREKHSNAPIVLMQTIVREHGYFDQKIGSKVSQQNINIYQEYLKLRKEGIENLHFIFGHELLGNDHEGTVDGTHPNDLGFDRMVQLIYPQIIPILKKLN